MLLVVLVVLSLAAPLPLDPALSGGTLSGGSTGATMGERALGEPARVDTSSSLNGPRVGLERSERAVTSASSLRRASSSRSNLESFGVKKRISREYGKDALAAEDLDVEATAIPYADGEEKQHVCRAPEGTVIEEEDRGKFGDDRVDYEMVSVWA